MPPKERLLQLLKQYAGNTASEADIKEMLQLLKQDAGDESLEAFITTLRQETATETMHQQVDWEKMWSAISETAIEPALHQPVTPVRKLYGWRVAAAAIILITIGSFWWLNQRQQTIPAATPPITIKEAEKEIQPGGDRAILTLADGSQILLDSSADGKLATQGNSEVVKLANGQLAYKGTGRISNVVLYNTMSTPRGGQYRLILPDGSKVWLNATSSIRYPTSFEGGVRKVEITGEAYFEVAKDALHPFSVAVHRNNGNAQEVEVLGTHFNINAYNDESTTNTTLLEGSVKVKTTAGNALLLPDQQAQLDENGKLKINSSVNIAEVMAWKDGYFIFREADIKTIMRQVMRWYDVEVKYEGDIPARYFTADISMNKTLQGVLKILELSNIHFRLEGRTIIVTS
ncbi:FecR family protein [Flavihumibacter petaseus]|uniref:Putative anti-sigma factor n=1 Tax=Flavihumibacter petaseus NBRC 106054 TaxID=1220578 RepID=A0A0E9MYQ3_9BACT|nr:FecR family protein [Flavihumibacter petaseus]GAO42724.1 putative anti-sigma factor [Flavihumibacter petaseus NBRC 106054]